MYKYHSHRTRTETALQVSGLGEGREMYCLQTLVSCSLPLPSLSLHNPRRQLTLKFTGLQTELHGNYLFKVYLVNNPHS